MSWTTQDEKRFIKGLGAHGVAGKKIPREDLLKGYIAGTAHRVVWEDIDSAVIRAFAEQEMASRSNESLNSGTGGQA